MSTYSEVVSDIVKRGEEVIDNFWNLLDHPDFPFINLHSTTNSARNFPPYNIIENKDGKVRLEMAVAGYNKDSIKVEKEGNTLMIRCKGNETNSTDVYRHKGICSAAFLRTFDLNVNTVVEGVELKDGILMVVVSNTKPKSSLKTTFEIK